MNQHFIILFKILFVRFQTASDFLTYPLLKSPNSTSSSSAFQSASAATAICASLLDNTHGHKNPKSGITDLKKINLIIIEFINSHVPEKTNHQDEWQDSHARQLHKAFELLVPGKPNYRMSFCHSQ
jgi:hypothetical protein